MYRRNAKSVWRRPCAFLLETCPHEHGFLYHFIDIDSGKRLFNSELSSIDTAILLCGVLICRQYFAGNARIAALATTFYRRIDWEWMLNGGTALSMGWLPDQGFLQYRWDIYAELMTMYLMAIGSPTHPIPPATWDSLQRPVINFGGIEYISGVAPLFIHQYAHAWCDYRDQRDRHANYFSNSIAATRAHQLFCIGLGQKYPWIDQDMWGISASDSRRGYRVWGGPPAMGELDGTIVPSATAGSLPFLPAETSHVLLNLRKQMGGKTWTRYGFVDAFHPKSGWIAEDVLGINQGISLLMAENLRTGFCLGVLHEESGDKPRHARGGFPLRSRYQTPRCFSSIRSLISAIPEVGGLVYLPDFGFAVACDFEEFLGVLHRVFFGVRVQQGEAADQFSRLSEWSVGHGNFSAGESYASALGAGHAALCRQQNA